MNLPCTHSGLCVARPPRDVFINFFTLPCVRHASPLIV
jgi:hypothetical protein